MFCFAVWTLRSRFGHNSRLVKLEAHPEYLRIVRADSIQNSCEFLLAETARSFVGELDTMSTEYECLRSEIHEWQDRRFTVLVASIGFVTAILGLKIVDESAEAESWPLVSSLLLAFLSAACALIWYTRRACAKIAAYLVVFHESECQSSSGWEERLQRLKERGLDFLDLDRTRAIATLFAGVSKDVFEQTARHMPLVAGAADAVVGLRKAGFRVGIVSDSYAVAVEIVRRRVFADFSVAHLMRFRAGRATGDVTLSPAMVHPRGCPEHAICKFNVTQHLIEQLGLDASQVLAVGDGENDICLLRAAGLSFAFRPATEAVRSAGKVVVEGDLADLLEIATPNTKRNTDLHTEQSRRNAHGQSTGEQAPGRTGGEPGTQGLRTRLREPDGRRGD